MTIAKRVVLSNNCTRCEKKEFAYKNPREKRRFQCLVEVGFENVIWYKQYNDNLSLISQ